MKPVVIFNVRLLRVFNIWGITLFPIILIRCSENDAISSKLLHHELTHIEQIRTLGFFTFYKEYIKEHIRVGYQNNKYEIEAHFKQGCRALYTNEYIGINK